MINLIKLEERKNYKDKDCKKLVSIFSREKNYNFKILMFISSVN